MGLPVQNSLESGLASGTTITSANSGGSAGNAFDATAIDFGAGSGIYDNTRSAHGTLSAKLTEATPAAAIYIGWDAPSVGTPTEIWGRAYVYRTDHPVGNQYPIYFLDSGNNRAGIIYWGNDGTLFVFDSTLGVSASGVAGWQTGVWNRCEFHFKCGTATTGTLEARLYAGDSTVLLDSASFTNGNLLSSVSKVHFGDNGGNQAGQVSWFDDLNVNTLGFPGPITTPILYWTRAKARRGRRFTTLTK